KIFLVRAWIRCWGRAGLWINHIPPAWWAASREFQPRSGNFEEIRRLLSDKARSFFQREWVPKLLGLFAEPLPSGKFRLKGGELSLLIGGAWAYCKSCRTTQRPFPGRHLCVNCGQDTAMPVDPETDPVFVARKGYYRASTIEALRIPPS